LFFVGTGHPFTRILDLKPSEVMKAIEDNQPEAEKFWLEKNKEK
jgi:hypothetical protein